jgi:putative ABC transport system permease protein
VTPEPYQCSAAGQEALRSARVEVNTIAGQLAAEYPATNQSVGVLVQDFNNRFNGGETAPVFVSLLWAVGFVLLIGCANVATLLLAHAVGRSREVSIRATLGAAFGWLISLWGLRVFDAALVPAVKPTYIDFSMDFRVMAYLLAITIGTGIVFGLAPALQLSRRDIHKALRESGNTPGLLVVREVSLAVVLLAGAGLMVRSLLNTYRANIGVETANILSMSLNLRNKKYPRTEDQILFYDRLKEHLESLPGVESRPWLPTCRLKAPISSRTKPKARRRWRKAAGPGRADWWWVRIIFA